MGLLMKKLLLSIAFLSALPTLAMDLSSLAASSGCRPSSPSASYFAKATSDRPSDTSSGCHQKNLVHPSNSSKEEKSDPTNYFHIEELPGDVIGEILNFLNLNDSYSASLVCKRFKEIIKSLNKRNFNPQERKVINQCIMIRKLALLSYKKQKEFFF